MDGVHASPMRRRRPKDRKARILAAAAEAFSDRGYHAVGVDDIAAALEMSGPALYRHYPTKYALFVDAVRMLSDTLLSATEVTEVTELTGEEGSDPRARLDDVLAAIIRTTIDNRRTGGLYRWEGRYLLGDDKAALHRAITILGDRVRVPLQQMRPDLADADAVVISAAAISVIASMTAHRTVMSAKRIEELLRSTAWSILLSDLPVDDGRRPTPPLVDGSRDSTREVLLNEAVLLFHRRGFHDVSIEDIGAAAGITASSVYRHFSSKADLLATAFHRADERLTVALSESVAAASTPEETLATLVRLYTRLAFERSESMSVYFAEIGNLPADRRTELRRVQRANVEEWAHLLREARPELDVAQSRFLVHSALGLVFDVGRLLRFDPSPGAVRRVAQLMSTTLSIPGTTPS